MTQEIIPTRKPFTSVTAVAVPINQANVDTDQIIPARFLSLPREKMSPHLFRDVRYNDNGSPNPEFVLNQPAYKDARIIVAERNFACGSSREMAVTVIQDNGFKAVIAPSFGDIFFSNCFQNGMLPIRLADATVRRLAADAARDLRDAVLEVDLERQRITTARGETIGFEVEPLRRRMLLEGQDEISLTLQQEPAIAAFQIRDRAERPWLYG